MSASGAPPLTKMDAYECRSSCHVMRRRFARLCAAHSTSWKRPGSSDAGVAGLSEIDRSAQ
jgi:hypothetical protein